MPNRRPSARFHRLSLGVAQDTRCRCSRQAGGLPQATASSGGGVTASETIYICVSCRFTLISLDEMHVRRKRRKFDPHRPGACNQNTHAPPGASVASSPFEGDGAAWPLRAWRNRPVEGPKGWQNPPLRGPPKPAYSSPGPKPGHQGSLFTQEGNPDSRVTHEVDPDFLEFARREEIDEPEPVWEP